MKLVKLFYAASVSATLTLGQLSFATDTNKALQQAKDMSRAMLDLKNSSKDVSVKIEELAKFFKDNFALSQMSSEILNKEIWQQTSNEGKVGYLRTYIKFLAGFLITSLGQADNLDFGQEVQAVDNTYVITHGLAKAGGTDTKVSVHYFWNEKSNSFKIFDVKAAGHSYILERDQNDFKSIIKSMSNKCQEATADHKVGLVTSYMQCMIDVNFDLAVKTAAQCRDEVVSKIVCRK